MTFENPIQDYVEIVKHGISKKLKDGKPKKVIIVGAGLTGLTSAAITPLLPSHSLFYVMWKCLIPLSCAK